MSTYNKHITFNAKAFLQAVHIDHTDVGPKATKNRVQVHCPFCPGSKNFHLGIHVTNAYANCWRCGPHSLISTIRELLHITWKEVYSIIEEYGDISSIKTSKHIKVSGSKLVLPGLIEPLKNKHRKYLIERHFDPDDIINTWNVQSVGPVGRCSHRIYIPIYYRGEVVSYQCRSTQKGNDIVRYITCDRDKETVFHKSILYGLDYAISDNVAVVEGATDTWRLGPGSLATFGMEFMKEQIYQLSRFKKVYLMYDPEPAAIRQAEKMANELAFMGKCEPYVIDIKTLGVEDPGDLDQRDANELMLDITRGTLKCI